MSVGIIIEANPFHYGHRYLINKAKELYPNETIIGITSTSFSMRGELSLLDKFSKIRILLNEGFDLVFELPIAQTLQSADYFSDKCVRILHKLNVNNIVAGCECDDIRVFDYLFKIINSVEYKNQFLKQISLKLSYKKAVEKTLRKLNIDSELIEVFLSPNMTLAFQYYTTIKKNNFNIQLNLIKRTNNYYINPITGNNIISASDIRRLYVNNIEIAQYVPYKPSFIDLTEAEKKLNTIICFQYIQKELNDENITDYEGITNYIVKNIKFEKYFSKLVENLANKKYSASRIRRILISSILKLSSLNESIYLRLLGINNTGKEYLNKLPKKCKEIIFSSPNELKKVDNEIKKLLEEEIKTTRLYGLLLNDEKFYLNEYKLPIKKEGM